MKTSVIRHPEKSYFIRRCDWQIKALETDKTGTVHMKRSNATETAAEILSIMEYHCNNKLANRILRNAISAAMGEQGRQLEEIGHWMPYSVAYLNELLMDGRSPGLIKNALDLLIDRAFIDPEVPADIPKNYGGNCSWYKLEVDYINQWIDENITKSWLEQKEEDRLVPVEATGDTPKRGRGRPKKEGPAKIVNTIAEYYKHVHGKNASFVIDSKRRTAIEKRLSEKRSLDQCAQAIIGNLYSDWHQGRHPENNKVFDDIELIFRNAKSFEAHLGYAEEAGITAEIALEDLQGTLEGKDSRYAKKGKKGRQNASNGHREVRIPGNAGQYKEFSHAVAAFFATGDVETKMIMEFCETNNSLKTLANGLLDPNYLAEQLIEALKLFVDEIEQSVRDQVKEFSGLLCKVQQINYGS